MMRHNCVLRVRGYIFNMLVQSVQLVMADLIFFIHSLICFPLFRYILFHCLQLFLQVIDVPILLSKSRQAFVDCFRRERSSLPDGRLQ